MPDINLSGSGYHRGSRWCGLSWFLSGSCHRSRGGRSSTLGFSRWVLKRSNRDRLIDLGWVLVDLGGGNDFAFGFALEEVTDTGRETTADLDTLGVLLLFLLFLLDLVLL